MIQKLNLYLLKKLNKETNIILKKVRLYLHYTKKELKSNLNKLHSVTTFHLNNATIYLLLLRLLELILIHLKKTDSVIK